MKTRPSLTDVSPASFPTWLNQLLEDELMPARIIRPSRYSITGYVPTRKGSKAQEAESLLEQDFLTLLEYDKTIDRYRSQPFTLRWKDASGKRRSYTPDVIARYSWLTPSGEHIRRVKLFEVKPEKVLREDWAELKPKFRAAIGWARDFGCVFHLVTEKSIRTPYLKNVQFLMSFRSSELGHDPYAGKKQRLITKALVQLEHSTPRDLLTAVTQDRILQAELIPWMWNLLVMNYIGADLHQPLTMASPIWANELTKHLADH